MTEENITQELDPMTAMQVRLEKLASDNEALSKKFTEQSDMLRQALDSNMKLVALMNTPASQPEVSQQAVPSPQETASKAYEEIVSYFR